MEKGKIVQVLGPVIDVAFPGKLPMIKDALTVDNGGKTCVMEVAQHMGNGIVRCISLSSTEGFAKDMEVTATGSCIKVPVGTATLGRMFNVLGEAIDDAGEVKTEVLVECATQHVVLFVSLLHRDVEVDLGLFCIVVRQEVDGVFGHRHHVLCLWGVGRAFVGHQWEVLAQDIVYLVEVESKRSTRPLFEARLMSPVSSEICNS